MPNFLKYGLMAGVLYAVYAIVLQFSGSDLRFNSSLAFAIILILPIVFMVMAVKAERSLQEGLISFGEALKTSFLTYLIFIIIAIGTGILMIQMYSAEDWNQMLDFQRNFSESMLSAVGMDEVMIDEELEKITLESLKENTTAGTMMLGSLIYVFVGLITSLVLSAIMKKNPTP